MAAMLLFSFNSWGQYDGTGTFVKITSETELVDGFYVIANSGESEAMNNTNTSDYFENTSISPSSGEITDPDPSIVWEIQDDGSGNKSIYDSETSKYVALTSDDNAAYAVDNQDSDESLWTITYETDKFVVTNNSYTSRLLEYNSSAPRFACYEGTQEDLSLFKMVVDATISPATAQYDMDAPSDLTTTITWNDASSVSGITDDKGNTLTAGTHYGVSGSDLTINQGYLDTTLTTDGASVSLTISFDAGADATFDITEAADATIDPAADYFDIGAPSDVTTTVTWNDASSVTGITDDNGNTLTAGTHYGVEADTLTINQGYLDTTLTTEGESVSLTISFDAGADATFVIEAVTTYSVTYDANDANATGTVPVDNNAYAEGDEVTVLGQSDLALEGYIFAGWNTQADGSGETYQEGDTFTMGASDVTLYAVWEEIAQLSIYEIRYSEAEDGASPYEGEYVNTSGVVTANDGSGFFMQDSASSWNGIYVYGNSIPEPGDTVEAGSKLGFVDEGIFDHPIFVPFDFQGTAEIDTIVDKGTYNVDDVIATATDENGEKHEFNMYFTWPVKVPMEEYQERVLPTEPMVTQTRVIDTFFPVAKGPAARPADRKKAPP